MFLRYSHFSAAKSVLVVLVLGSSPVAWGDYDWQLHSGLALRTGYDSNLRLNTIDELDTPYYRAAVDLSASGKNETNGIDLAANWVRADYENLGAEINDDYRASARLNHERTTWSLGLGVERARVNTLATALDDTGLTELGVQRNHWAITPSAEWRLSARSQLQLQSSFVDTSYTSEQSFVDFRNQSHNLSFVRSINEKTTAIVGASFSEFETQRPGRSSETHGYSVGLFRQASEARSWRVSVGRDRTSTRSLFFFGPFVFTNDDTERTWRFDGEWQQRWQTADLTLAAGRSVQPLGNGSVAARSFVAASFRKRLAERLSLRLGALLRDFAEVNAGALANDDREALRYTATLDWDFAQRWRARLELAHREQAFDLRNDVARGNRVYLSVHYRSGGA